MSALALEVPQLATPAVAPTRTRQRQVRGPQARSRAAVSPVATPPRLSVAGPSRAIASTACSAPAAVPQYRLTPRGVAVITAAVMLTVLLGLVTVVGQFLAIPTA